MQNGFIERFNRSYRKEILDAYLFFNFSEVREHIQACMDEYNSNKPHEGLVNLTPTELSKNIRHKQQINQLAKLEKSNLSCRKNGVFKRILQRGKLRFLHIYTVLNNYSITFFAS